MCVCISCVATLYKYACILLINRQNEKKVINNQKLTCTTTIAIIPILEEKPTKQN